MIFLIILLAINLANFTQAAETSQYDNMKVKPLPTLSSVTSSLSTTTDNVPLKTKNRVSNATPSPVKLAEQKQSGRDLYDNNDYEKLEQLFEKSNEPIQETGHKLTNKELVDKIFELILNNKHVDVDCHSYHCSGFDRQNYKKRIQKNDGFEEKTDYNRFGDFGYNNKYEDYNIYNKHMYPMKIPLNGLPLETPRDGLLGKFHFRFVPMTNMRRGHERE